MADVKALIRDPRFKTLAPTIAQQRAAAAQIDPRLGQLTDEQFKAFAASVTAADIWPDPKRKATGVGKGGFFDSVPPQPPRLKGTPGANKFFDPMEAGWNLAAQGKRELGTGVDPTIKGVSDIGRGFVMMGYPYAAAAATAGGLPGVLGAAATMPLGMGAEWGAKAAHIPEGTSQAIGDIFGIGSGYVVNRLAGSLGRNVAPYLAKIPILPAKWKAGLKTLSFLTPETPPTPGEYLKHTEGRPGNWAYGLGVGPRAGSLPEWLRNLRGFTYEDQQNKQGLSGYGKQPPTPQPSPFDAKRTGGFGSTGLTGERLPSTPMTPRPTGFQAGNRPGMRPDTSKPLQPWEIWRAGRRMERGPSEPAAPIASQPPAGMYQTRRPPMGPPETVYSPETLDVTPSSSAPRTYPAAAPPPRMPTKRVGGFGRTAVPPQDVQPRETMGPRESEPQEFTPTTIPEPPLPEDIVRGAEREPAAPHEGDTPPAYGTPGYADWFTKTWPNLPLPKGAGGLPPEPITGSTARPIPPGETRPPGYQPDVGGVLPGQTFPDAPPPLKPENQAVVDKVLQEKGLAPTITPPPVEPVTPPAATEPIVPPAGQGPGPGNSAPPQGVGLGDEAYWRSLPTIKGQISYLNSRFHAAAREMDLPGAPEGKNVSGTPTARALYNKGWMELTPDQMNTVHQFLLEHKRLPVPADVESGLYKHPVEPGTAMDNPPAGTVTGAAAVGPVVEEPIQPNPMLNPPEPIVSKKGKGKGRRVTIQKAAPAVEPEVKPSQVAKPAEELKSNAERVGEEPSLPSSDPADVSANAIYGDDYINLRPNSQVSLRRFYGSHGNRYPTIDDVKSGEFKRR